MSNILKGRVPYRTITATGSSIRTPSRKRFLYFIETSVQSIGQHFLSFSGLTGFVGLLCPRLSSASLLQSRCYLIVVQ